MPDGPSWAEPPAARSVAALRCKCDESSRRAPKSANTVSSRTNPNAADVSCRSSPHRRPYSLSSSSSMFGGSVTLGGLPGLPPLLPEWPASIGVAQAFQSMLRIGGCRPDEPGSDVAAPRSMRGEEVYDAALGGLCGDPFNGSFRRFPFSLFGLFGR